MKKIALFFDRYYIDAHACFTELIKHLVETGYHIDLYYHANPYNPPPVFYDDRIRLFQIPTLKYHFVEFWGKMRLMKEKKYTATIGTPINGAWLAHKVSKQQNIPMFYLADEIFDPEVRYHEVDNWDEAKKKDITANKAATATIALGEERYQYQKKVNGLNENHRYFIIPNTWAGEVKKRRSCYFRDFFNIDDKKPIVLFIGTLNWKLAQKIMETTRHLDPEETPYHIVFHGRSVGMMGEDKHEFIKISRLPLPSYLMGYAVSSADIGLVLYDKDIEQERNNAWTGGKIATYLKNQLPVIAGNVDEFRRFEQARIGLYWDGEEPIDKMIRQMIKQMPAMSARIPAYYKQHLEYSQYFSVFEHFLKEITE